MVSRDYLHGSLEPDKATRVTWTLYLFVLGYPETSRLQDNWPDYPEPMTNLQGYLDSLLPWVTWIPSWLHETIYPGLPGYPVGFTTLFALGSLDLQLASRDYLPWATRIPSWLHETTCPESLDSRMDDWKKVCLKVSLTLVSPWQPGLNPAQFFL